MSQRTHSLTFPILMYHQVDAVVPKYRPDGTRSGFRSLTVTPSAFARQMGMLKLLGYRGVSMTDLLPYLRGDKTSQKDGKVVGITFDDGYQNNLRHALPVLQHHGFGSTCYVISQLLGTTNRWDIANRVAPSPLMTVEECKQWIAGGQEIGSHTRHHVRLTEMTPTIAKEEITTAKQELESLLGAMCDHFCYPYGLFDASHRDLTQAAGYTTATTTVNRLARTQDDLFQLPRIGILKNTTLLGLLWQLWRSQS